MSDKDREEARKIRAMIVDACEVDYPYEGEDGFVSISEEFIEP